MQSFAAVYRIKSDCTGKTYIGRAVDVHKRWSRHRWELNRGTHRNHPLQADWIAHGEEAFVFEVVKRFGTLSGPALDAALADAEVEALAAIPLSQTYNLMEAGQLGLTASQETRAKLSAERTARWAEPGYKERLRESHRLKHTDPEYSMRRAESLRVAKNTPENKGAVSDHSKAMWQDPAHREAQTAIRKANWEDPEYRARQHASRVASAADPEVKARRSAALKAAWARRKAKAAQ